MKSFLAWGVIWLACLFVAAWALVAMPASALLGSGRRGWKLAVSFDQLGNVAGGGDEDETISAHCWRRREQPRYARLAHGIDWVFERLEGKREHCRRAWEQEQASARARIDNGHEK